MLVKLENMASVSGAWRGGDQVESGGSDDRSGAWATAKAGWQTKENKIVISV